MTRIFNEHNLRAVRSLDGIWQYRKDPADCGVAENWFLGLSETKSIAVPSVWNTERGELTYEGAVWYEKRFFSEGGVLRFCFDAVMTEACVWLDGVPIGSHYGGFSQFTCTVSDVKEGEHRLCVRVDNRFDEKSIPQTFVDWYHYGGIVRSVTVESLKGICVLSERLEYTLSEDLQTLNGNFVVRLYNAESEKRSTLLRARVGAWEVNCAEVELEGRSEMTLTLPTFTLEGVPLWDVGAPALFDVALTTDTDDLFDRVGFRRVEVCREGILLNGHPVEIRGVNRHEEHPDWGFAFPLQLMKRDVDLLLEMSGNAFRGSHYPNSKAFVDFLDEAGVLFWSEIPIWGCGFSDEALADPTVVARGLEMHREMTEQYYNHPSIILWGMHNEIHSYSEAALEMTKTYYRFLKENGGNRAVVFATCHPETDICLEYTDIICINQYFGWYYGFEEDAWETFLERFCAHADALGVGDKPILMSEFGCAAIYGCHDDPEVLWSEENQAKQISHCLSLFHAHPRVTGSYIWQFCDMRTSREAGLNRARGFNNKGILNEYRKPKLAYRAASELYATFAKEEETLRKTCVVLGEEGRRRVKKKRPVRVIQFGEGGFLRGFADWMLQKMNDKGLFDGSVAVVQPIKEGMCDALTAQNCVYTHLIRGAEGVEVTRIDVIDRCVKPYEDFEEYLALADIPEARFIISNTTEAGIAFSPDDRLCDAPPASFPAKLVRLLLRRYERGLDGFVILPCELIERNGDNLKKTVLQYVELWELPAEFAAWVEEKNIFCNTLVDRINTGYPKEEAEELGYGDPMLNTSEFFHLWVIETAYDLSRELPFGAAGLNVILTPDGLERYRTRKVRILNGAHTSLVAYALLCGFDTVRSCMEDEKMNAFVRTCLFEEIIPTLDLPRAELEEYAENVLRRFSNPYIKHYLSSIALNSISKFRVRVLPSILEYRKRFGKYPSHLLFAFAKLIIFYKTGTPNDAPEVVEWIKKASIAEILADQKLWGEDLTPMLKEVERHAHSSER